jgi:hypothetical protein
MKQAWRTSLSQATSVALTHRTYEDVALIAVGTGKDKGLKGNGTLPATKYPSNRSMGSGRPKVNANRLALTNRRSSRISPSRSALSQHEARIPAPRGDHLGRVTLMKFQRSLVKESLVNYSIPETVDLLNAWDQEDQEYLLSTFDNRTRMVLRYKLQNTIVTLDSQAKKYRRDRFIQRLQHNRSAI